MTELERLAAIEEIRTVKAKYWRGCDSFDDELVRSILAEDCVLDYRGAMTDPVTGIDQMPETNLVLKGREAWSMASLGEANIVSVTQGHQHEITFSSDTSAEAIWYFTDHLFLPPGGPFTRLTGYGRYHDTYEKAAEGWKLKNLRSKRFWIEVS